MIPIVRLYADPSFFLHNQEAQTSNPTMVYFFMSRTTENLIKEEKTHRYRQKYTENPSMG